MTLRKKSAKTAKPPSPASLKSRSGAGFGFEDKVAATLMTDMLGGIASLGRDWTQLETIERQAPDWEPFGDLLLTVWDKTGAEVKCGCSVKSNRPITAKGAGIDLRHALWTALALPAFRPSTDALALFSADLGQAATDVFESVCRQARHVPAERLRQKVIGQNERTMLNSFRGPRSALKSGAPGWALARLVHRGFDFEQGASRSEAEAIAWCQRLLRPDVATTARARDLWKALVRVAEQQRVSGGVISRASLAAELRCEFALVDDPGDESVWANVHEVTQQTMAQTQDTLPGGITLPRQTELAAIRKQLDTSRIVYALGESGAGKSALVKRLATEHQKAGAEIVWVRAEEFSTLLRTTPDFTAAAGRTRRSSAIVVIDALDTCYADDSLRLIALTVAGLVGGPQSAWKAILVCQTTEWSRVSRTLLRHLSGPNFVAGRFVCGELLFEDMSVVCAASTSIHALYTRPELRLLLSSPKVLDLLLSGQLAENRALAGEADLVDWWWDDAVRCGKPIAEEERVARLLAAKMADDLTSELSPDVVAAPAAAIEALLHRRVLRRTADGRLRFEHDLLADWSRVMHLRSLGNDVTEFMRRHVENPPWLHAIRLLSQHLLERTADVARWREMLVSCQPDPKQRDESQAENLQVIDPWLEGIAFSANSAAVLEAVSTDLFALDAWLLRRLLRRLLHSATLPDPILQRQLQKSNPQEAAELARWFRLPMPGIWSPVVTFLVGHPDEATNLAPVELAELAEMWERLARYVGESWRPLADLILLNAERELRREVAGDFRHFPAIRFGRGRKDARSEIYKAALAAAGQNPPRAAKLVLKAAGRAAWEPGDVDPNSRDEWNGIWTQNQFDIGSGYFVKSPPESWDDGPHRMISRDFCDAWFASASPLALYRALPQEACEATLGFAIDWPKAEPRDRHATLIERFGFQFGAGELRPSLWTKGPFILFLRDNWALALDMIVRLVNFATDRYGDWWPYEPKIETLTVAFDVGQAAWRGNEQVFSWYRTAANTPSAITCALMAIEKWLDEQIEQGKPVKPTVDVLVTKGRSLAFAGLLTGIGKRHPALFAAELKPLLFHREIYAFDAHAVQQYFGDGNGLLDGKIVNEIRAQWNSLPGRRELLRDMAHRWLVTNDNLAPVFTEVSEAWTAQAKALPPDVEERVIFQRWAWNFARKNWKKRKQSDGTIQWSIRLPAALRDKEAEVSDAIKMNLLTLPSRAGRWLEERAPANDASWRGVIKQLKNWAPIEKVSAATPQEEDASMLRDHRHAKAAMVAMVLSLGADWLMRNPKQYLFIEQTVRELLQASPRFRSFSADEHHDDWESFMARAVVRCWARAPRAEFWRGYTARFAMAYRYRTVRHLLEEAFMVRDQLGRAYGELEAFVLVFAVEREQATRWQWLKAIRKVDDQRLEKWASKWGTAFARGQGPKWHSEWRKIEKLAPFQADEQIYGKTKLRKLRRRDYGLDMQLIVAAFSHLPSLGQAGSTADRKRWLEITEQILAAFVRTLPIKARLTPESEWAYDHWGADEVVFRIVAQRIHQAMPAERRRLWLPIMRLPVTAHHHIEQLFSAVYMESIRVDPPDVATLTPIWIEMVSALSPLTAEKKGRYRDAQKLWANALFYGSPLVSSGEIFFRPLVEKLRPYYLSCCDALRGEAWEQSSLARFLTTKSGEILLVDALARLRSGWDNANDYFWEQAAEQGHFEHLVAHAWATQAAALRANPDAFAAFKTAVLNLAAHHSEVAIDLQTQMGK